MRICHQVIERRPSLEGRRADDVAGKSAVHLRDLTLTTGCSVLSDTPAQLSAVLAVRFD